MINRLTLNSTAVKIKTKVIAMPTLEQMKHTEWFKSRPQIIQDLYCDQGLT